MRQTISVPHSNEFLGVQAVKISLRRRLEILGWALLCTAGLISCVPTASDANDVASETAEVDSTAPESGDTNSSSAESPLLAQGQILPVTAKVELGGQNIGLEVARTPQQQATGLMFRESLPDDRGMLFPFEPARPVSFWMKNVSIPLDMVFIHDGEIVALSREVPPCQADPCPTYGPASQVVDYVLELRGGLATVLGLQIGDPVEIEWLEPVSAAES